MKLKPLEKRYLEMVSLNICKLQLYLLDDKRVTQNIFELIEQLTAIRNGWDEKIDRQYGDTMVEHVFK